MANKKLIDPEEIKKALEVLKPNGELFEVRLLEANGKGNYSGYFTDPELMIRQLNELQELRKYNVYISLNRIRQECYSRDQKDRFVKNVKTQTSDADIEGYTYLFIDVDPKRPSIQILILIRLILTRREYASYMGRWRIKEATLRKPLIE